MPRVRGSEILSCNEIRDAARRNPAAPDPFDYSKPNEETHNRFQTNGFSNTEAKTVYGGENRVILTFFFRSSLPNITTRPPRSPTAR